MEGKTDFFLPRPGRGKKKRVAERFGLRNAAIDNES
jgi:hypothetical protein